MSSWFGYTKKVLGTALSTLAQELEQTVVDFNDAVQEMGTSTEIMSDVSRKRNICSCDKVQQELLRESLELPKGALNHGEHPADQNITAVTRQVVYLPCMSTWPTTCLPPTFITTQPQSSVSGNSPDDQRDISITCDTKLSLSNELCDKYHSLDQRKKSLHSTYSPYEKECIFHRSAFLRMRLGEKRPGKVIRAPSYAHSLTSNEEESQMDYAESPGSVNDQMLPADIVSSSQSNSHALVPYTATAEHQFSPKWLGFFTFALAQVTSAVWMILDEPRQRKSPSNSSTFNNSDDSSGHRDLDEQPFGVSRGQFSKKMKLEVHQSPNYSFKLRNMEDPRLLSPVSICSAYSSESFEIIDATVAEEGVGVVNLLSESSNVKNQSCESPNICEFAVEEYTNQSTTEDMMTESSAEWINFNFSSLVSTKQGKETSSLETKTQSSEGISRDWVEHHFSTNAQSPQCQCESGGPQLPCTVHFYVVESDDGSSSFDVLSEPGEDEFVLY